MQCCAVYQNALPCNAKQSYDIQCKFLLRLQVNSSTKTPVNAIILTICTSALFAFLVEISVLSELVSIGTLFVFFMVSNAVLWRKYYVPGGANSRFSVGARLACTVIVSLGASITLDEDIPFWIPAIFIGLWVLCCLSFLLIKQQYIPKKFSVPLAPWVPCLGILTTLHLLASLGWPAYVRLVVWAVISALFYLLYGVHHSHEVAPGGQGKAR